MKHLFAILSIAILLFASTNLDDIFVLVGFFADRRYYTREIVAGQFVGIASLFGVCVGASLISMVISLPYVGLLGVVPILIGGKKLLNSFHERDKKEESLEGQSDGHRYGKVASVAVVTVANGGDNIAVYMPYFSIRSCVELVVIGLVFAIMTALWCFVARAIVKHPTLGAPLRRYGHRITPVVLICLGLLVLYQAGSCGLLLRHYRFRGY
jgi:cadmium resistance protein CadD (predicted permease)